MPEVKKVIHVMRRFVPEKWGGTESVVFNLSQEQLKSRINASVFCTDMFSRPGIQVFRKLSIRRFSYLLPWFGLSEAQHHKLELKGGNPLALSLFFGLLAEKNISIIHTHVQHRLGGIARTVARLKKIPYVVSIHGGHFTLPVDQTDMMSEPFTGKFEWGKVFGAVFGARRVIEDAAAVICIGKDEYNEVLRRYPEKPVYLIPNGVDFGYFSSGDGTEFRETHRFSPHEKIILCVSRIDRQKNQLGLLRAFASFSENHPDHRLVLIGAAVVEDYRDEILNEVVHLNLSDKVKLIEGLRPDDPLLPAAYHAAELFVLPSVYEPFGIVVLEAWAAGLPVIASEVCGICDFAEDGGNLMTFKAGNDEELAGRLAELADHVALRSDLSCQAYGDVAMHFKWAKIATDYLNVYEQVMTQA
jgi:glycosyltransferase involved in cell wall biosynthesis